MHIAPRLRFVWFYRSLAASWQNVSSKLVRPPGTSVLHLAIGEVATIDVVEGVPVHLIDEDAVLVTATEDRNVPIAAVVPHDD